MEEDYGLCALVVWLPSKSISLPEAGQETATRLIQ